MHDERALRLAMQDVHLLLQSHKELFELTAGSAQMAKMQTSVLERPQGGAHAVDLALLKGVLEAQRHLHDPQRGVHQPSPAQAISAAVLSKG